MKVLDPMKAIRAYCLDCQDGSSKMVRYCPSDGVNTPKACELWPCRFGMRPKTAARKHGIQFLTPGALPHAGISIDDCEGESEAVEPVGVGKTQ